jgi:hypothetical protein
MTSVHESGNIEFRPTGRRSLHREEGISLWRRTLVRAALKFARVRSNGKGPARCDRGGCRVYLE